MLVKEGVRNLGIAVPQEIVASYTVPEDLVRRSHYYRKPLKGVRINELSPLWPWSMLREELMKGAKKMTADLAKQGLELLTAEADVAVWGPYKARARDWRTDATHDLARTAKAWGRQAGEDIFPDVAEYRFVATFLARRGYATETPPSQPQEDA